MAETKRPAKRAKLLSDVSSSESSDEEADKHPSTLKVNEEFARRFEHNKKREEMHRLEEKFQKAPSKSNGTSAGRNRDIEEDDEDEDDSEEDESEDDEGELATKDLDAEILATLQAIKHRDPRVYDKSAKFYSEFEEDAEGEDGEMETKPKEKPMYLHDYHRQNLLAGHTGEAEEEADSIPPTYQQEQEAMKRQLVNSMHAATNGTAGDDDDKDTSSGDDEEDFLVAKRKGQHSTLPPKPPAPTPRITDTDILAADADPETYLSNFLAARAWVPEPTSHWQAFDSDDSAEEARADAFEEAYNLRFEEPATANETLRSFARDVGKYGVRRDELTGRKRGREREREKKEMERREREEERARLRKLRIEEVEGKVRRIREAAGLKEGVVDLEEWRDVIEGDWEGGRWKREMERRFGEEYYAEAEVDDDVEDGGRKKRKVQKPKWEDDIEIDDLVPGFGKEDAEPAFTLSSDEDEEEQREDGGAALPLDDPDELDGPEHKRKTSKRSKKDKAEAKRTARLQRRQIESLVDASVPLSLAQHPALTPSKSASQSRPPSQAQPPAFRYRSTSPVSFGLSAQDILFADDGQLNEYAGLKKLAAWRDVEKKRKDRKRYSKKQRLREWRREVFGGDGRPERPVGEEGVVRKEKSEGGDGGEKKGKRKRKGKKKEEVSGGV